MVKTTLFVINHVDGYNEVERICQEQKLPLGGTLFSVTDEIKPRLSYAISPVEAGFDYVQSLFDKFDQIVFLKDHDNLYVLSAQIDLERSLGIMPSEFNFKKLNNQKLNFFGCSHTAGTGHKTKDTIYANILSKRLGMECNNLAVPGMGNYHIEDTLTEYSIQHSNLIIQFSDIYRYRYVKDNIFVYLKTYDIEHRYSDSKFINDQNLIYNFQSIFKRTINRLRDSNNKFLITYIPHYESEYTKQAINFYNSFKEFVSTSGISVDSVPDGHLGIKSHQNWANRLYTRWTELYDEK